MQCKLGGARILDSKGSEKEEEMRGVRGWGVGRWGGKEEENNIGTSREQPVRDSEY